MLLAETVETGNKNRCMTEATHVLRRKLRFRAFPEQVCPRIPSLESVDYFGTSEHFAYFGLNSGMVFEGISICHFNSK